MIRIGADDQTVHPYFSRRMYRLLRQQGSNVTYSEIAEKEHWWWDTWKTNDGGVLNDPVIRNFAVNHAEVHLRAAAKSKWHVRQVTLISWHSVFSFWLE